jgi:SAM-dependent methyltransferase
MTQPGMDWEAAYRREAPPPWSIGKPQPELAALLDQVHGDVLDAGCGHAALSLELAARGHTVVGLDVSATAVSAATAAAAEQGLATASFAAVDITSFRGYDDRFSTIFDSGCLHALPPATRASYVESIFRAAAPGASLYILAFATEAFGDEDAGDRPGPHGLTETELREVVSTLWQVDDVRPARLYGNDVPLGGPSPDHTSAGEGLLVAPGFLLTAHKPER